jgi:predicted nucleic acid-binding protein
MRVFLDPNILLDVLLNRPALVSEIESVILRCEALGAEVFIAWHGLATAYYLLRRGRSEADALNELDRILAWARVATATDIAARRARTLGFRDFEDALQAVSAETCGADCIVTRNSSDFSLSTVAALLPDEFLRQYPAPEASTGSDSADDDNG